MTIVEVRETESVDRIANVVVAIASSKGGIEALKQVLGQFAPDFQGGIVIVQHISALFKSQLDSVLDRYTSLKVVTATEGAKILSGVVYVAPPDDHVIVNHDRTLSLSHAAKEHFVRPSAEYTFKSLAENYRQKAIAVVLTGYDGDGKEGVRVIKERGGTVIVQDRATSQVFDMPQTAIDTGCVDFVLPIEQVADGIINIVKNQ